MRRHLLVGVLALLLPSVYCQVDFSLECQAGYRITRIIRSSGLGHHLGILGIECEPVDTAAELILCEVGATVPQCAGSLEGCAGNAWLAGVHGYMLENTTEAILLDPMCCSSPNVRLDSNSCIHDQINEPTLDFEHSIVDDLAYRGMQCWHKYNKNGTLTDIVWKMEVCEFTSRTVTRTRSAGCRDCDCHCGLETCSDGSRPLRVTHKTLNSHDCGCRCECFTRCVRTPPRRLMASKLRSA